MFNKKKNNAEIDGFPMIKKHIIESIKYLATSGEQQLLLLPDFVCKPVEIALSLDDWLLMYRNGLDCKKNPLFTVTELNLISELNDMFKSFNQLEWTESAVMTSEKWENVRKFAKNVLDILGVEYSLPDKSSI